ncbi:MAG: DUF1580 domain-containing protein [Planctomycetota bacterium]
MNLLAEDVVSFAQAAKELPSNPNPSTLYRWASRGVRGVKLEVVRIGERQFTSRQALHRFLNATQN